MSGTGPPIAGRDDVSDDSPGLPLPLSPGRASNKATVCEPFAPKLDLTACTNTVMYGCAMIRFADATLCTGEG